MPAKNVLNFRMDFLLFSAHGAVFSRFFAQPLANVQTRLLEKTAAHEVVASQSVNLFRVGQSKQAWNVMELSDFPEGLE